MSSLNVAAPWFDGWLGESTGIAYTLADASHLLTKGLKTRLDISPEDEASANVEQD
jgi:hypothetical protein